jgi:WD40 repeat protein
MAFGVVLLSAQSCENVDSSLGTAIQETVTEDTDNDSLPDIVERNQGTDPDNPDSDADRMPDGWEVENGLDPTLADGMVDPDEDELSNLDEYLAQTDPRNPDSDGDGMPDGWETANGFDPTNRSDGDADTDADGRSNKDEFLSNTQPGRPDNLVHLRDLESRTENPSWLLFSPNGEMLVTYHLRDKYRMWRVADGTLEYEYENAGFGSLDFSPDGEMLAASGRSSLALIRASDGTHLTSRYYEPDANVVAFHPDGHLIATGCFIGNIELLPVPDIRNELVIGKHDDSVGAIAFSPDGEILATGARDTTYLWRTNEGGLLHDLGIKTSTLAFAPAGDYLATASISYPEQPVRLWRASEGELVSEYEHPALRLDFSPQGSLLAGVTSSNILTIWSVPELLPLYYFDPGGVISDMRFSPDGSLMATALTDGTVRLWEVRVSTE